MDIAAGLGRKGKMSVWSHPVPGRAAAIGASETKPPMESI